MNETLSIIYIVHESYLGVLGTSSILFLKEPSVNPFVGNPLQIPTLDPLPSVYFALLSCHTMPSAF